MKCLSTELSHPSDFLPYIGFTVEYAFPRILTMSNRTSSIQISSIELVRRYHLVVMISSGSRKRGIVQECGALIIRMTCIFINAYPSNIVIYC
jgi:hypothetical protein